jgi:drug/metabolite transporter (DMT)-like permease
MQTSRQPLDAPCILTVLSTLLPGYNFFKGSFSGEPQSSSAALELSRFAPVRIVSSSGRAPSHTLVWLALFFLTTVWAANFIAGKIALRYLPAMTLASIRVVLAGFFMLLLNPLCRRMPAFQPAPNSPPRKHTLRDFWTFLYLGFLGVTLNQVCFTIGLRYTSVTHSAIIVGMGPLYALVLAVLLRLESATLRKVFGMTLSLLGVLLLASAKDSIPHSPTALGDFITFIGSLGFAFYAALGKRVAARYDALTMTTYNFLFGALFVLPIAIHRAITLGPLPNWLAIPWPAWASLFYMALFSSTLAYLFYFWLLRSLEVTQLAAYNYLLPVSASLLGIVFLGERGSAIELFGGALALAGVYFVESTRDS